MHNFCAPLILLLWRLCLTPLTASECSFFLNQYTEIPNQEVALISLGSFPICREKSRAKTIFLVVMHDISGLVTTTLPHVHVTCGSPAAEHHMCTTTIMHSVRILYVFQGHFF